MSSGISRDEWLRALESAGFDDRNDPEAMTASELAAMVGIDRQAASRRLQRLEELGQATKTRKRVTSKDGRMLFSTAYRLIDPPKKKRR